MKMTTGLRMRIIHRYLGFFLAGIMAMYAISGIIMIYRNTDFLKHDVVVEKELNPNLSEEQVGSELKIKGFKPLKTEGNILYFEKGNYNIETGVATYTKKELPMILDKMEHLHKATTKSPVYWLNIFFGVSLLFFVISAFWMFMPKTTVFKKGVLFSFAGIVVTLILLFV